MSKIFFVTQILVCVNNFCFSIDIFTNFRHGLVILLKSLLLIFADLKANFKLKLIEVSAEICEKSCDDSS